MLFSFCLTINRTQNIHYWGQLHSPWGKTIEGDHRDQPWSECPGPVVWFGWGGMVWRNHLSFFNQCLQGRAVPDVLLVHCCGNNLWTIKSVKVVAGIKQDLQDLHQQFPQLKIIFSAITQRCGGGLLNPIKLTKPGTILTVWYLPLYSWRKDCIILR